MNETIKLIQNRKSIRSFQDKQINTKIKNQIIQSAMRSPTAGNMMLYSIIEVDNQHIKDQLVKSCDNQHFIAKAPLVLLFVADYQRWMDYFTVSNVKEYCENNNLLRRSPKEGDLMIACCDALIAAQTAVISAESLGIGSVYIGDIMENYEFHKQLFELPKYTFPISMVCFGYPTEKALNRKYTDRLDQNLVHFTDKYKRLNKDELSTMYETRELKHYPKRATNFGQHMYSKKFVSDFTIEMTRSVKKMIEEWCN